MLLSISVITIFTWSDSSTSHFSPFLLIFRIKCQASWISVWEPPQTKVNSAVLTERWVLVHSADFRCCWLTPAPVLQAKVVCRAGKIKKVSSRICAIKKGKNGRKKKNRFVPTFWSVKFIISLF